MTPVINSNAFYRFAEGRPTESPEHKLMRFIGDSYSKIPYVEDIPDRELISPEIFGNQVYGKGYDNCYKPFMFCRVNHKAPDSDIEESFGIVAMLDKNEWRLKEINFKEEDFFGFSDEERSDKLPDSDNPLWFLRNLFQNQYECYRIDHEAT